MEVLSPLRLGPERYPGFDHRRPSIEEAYYHPSFNQSARFGPKPPPSPPREMSSRISLPSIADILNPSRDEDLCAEKQRPSGHVRQTASSRSERQTRAQAQQPPPSYMPPTPPMSLESAKGYDPQPLPTPQPQHISRMVSKSFSPETRYSRPEFPSTNELHPIPNSEAAIYPSPSAMSVAPASTPSHYPRGEKRRSDAPHTMRSRTPPNFSHRTHISDIPTSLPPSSSIHTSRSMSSEFPAHQIPSLPKTNSLQQKFPQPSPPVVKVMMDIPPHRSLDSDYLTQSQSQPLFQQPFSPQSSPSSSKTSVHDSRVRSMSWHHHQQQHHLQQQTQPSQEQQLQRQHHPNSPYPPRPQPTTSVSASSIPLAGTPTDRYICPTCAKCFSRPSSLRIHSHSHTGEKPFRCSREGCGKAFSVRSNMKRHEKGCHAAVIVGPTGYLTPVSMSVGVGGVGANVSILPPQVQPQPQQPIGLGVRGLPSLAP